MPRRPRNTHPTPRNAAPGPIRTVAFISLGCPKNLVDSEKMLGLLAEDGLVVVADETQADAIVINTCGFLEAAKDESLGEIARGAELKKTGSCRRLIVAGCLVQRHRARMLEWCPEIDALIGVFDRDRVVQAVRGQPPGAQPNESSVMPVYSSIAATAALARKARGVDEQGYFESDAARLRLTPRHYAYLRVSEGCNQNCAFCTIPSIRGKMRSKPVPRLLDEARELLADGAFELNLIGQDTTSFGQDIGYEPGLAGMLTELDQMIRRESPGGAWVRLMYAYPSCFSDAMIDAIASLPSVVKYIDMPLQHINDQVLDRMRRRTSRALIETLLDKLCRRVPGLAIRTTFISGFPGETSAQHRELATFVRDFKFEAMGVFAFSPEPGTPAGTMHRAGQAVPVEETQARLDELMRIQQEVVFERQRDLARSAAEVDVLVDSPAAASGKNGRLFSGRTYRQAPQIDSLTYVQSTAKLAPGELVRCRLVEADGYDLVAQPVAHRTRKLRVL